MKEFNGYPAYIWKGTIKIMRKSQIYRMEYGKKFYKSLDKNKQSAEIIVPLVLNLLSDVIDVKKLSVADFGCGTGSWLSVYKKFGVKDVLGIDKGGGTGMRSAFTDFCK